MCFPARGWGERRPEGGPRAEGRAAGGPFRDPAAEDMLLGSVGVQRRAVHVARLTTGFAAEAEDGRVVDEAIGDGHGLGR